jgi:hypothetical protein
MLRVDKTSPFAPESLKYQACRTLQRTDRLFIKSALTGWSWGNLKRATLSCASWQVIIFNILYFKGFLRRLDDANFGCHLGRINDTLGLLEHDFKAFICQNNGQIIAHFFSFLLSTRFFHETQQNSRHCCHWFSRQRQNHLIV